MKDFSIFNTQLELGLRSLYLLKSVYPSMSSIDRLVYFDYLTIYTKDSKVSLDSLHPEYPLRAIELFTKRETLRNGLFLMSCKGLIEVKYMEDGIYYSANSNTNWFLDGLKGIYSENLMERTNLIADSFRQLSDVEIKKFIDSNIKNWGNEIENYFPYKEEVL